MSIQNSKTPYRKSREKKQNRRKPWMLHPGGASRGKNSRQHGEARPCRQPVFDQARPLHRHACKTDADQNKPGDPTLPDAPERYGSEHGSRGQPRAQIAPICSAGGQFKGVARQIVAPGAHTRQALRRSVVHRNPATARQKTPIPHRRPARARNSKAFARRWCAE